MPPPPWASQPPLRIPRRRVTLPRQNYTEIRNVELTTRRQIQEKQEELRQLVGTRYRDLIDSADSRVLMKSSSDTISSNVFSIHSHSLSLSPPRALNWSTITLTDSKSTESLVALSTWLTLLRISGVVWTNPCSWTARYPSAKLVQYILHDVNKDIDHLNFPLLSRASRLRFPSGVESVCWMKALESMLMRMLGLLMK